MERNRMLHCLSIEPDDVVFFPRPPFLENLLCDAMSCSTVATKKKAKARAPRKKKDKNARGVEQNDIKKPAGQSTLLFPKKKESVPLGDRETNHEISPSQRPSPRRTLRHSSSPSNHEPIRRVPPDERKRGERRDDGSEPRIPLLVKRQSSALFFSKDREQTYRFVLSRYVDVHSPKT